MLFYVMWIDVCEIHFVYLKSINNPIQTLFNLGPSKKRQILLTLYTFGALIQVKNHLEIKGIMVPGANYREIGSNFNEKK